MHIDRTVLTIKGRLALLASCQEDVKGCSESLSELRKPDGYFPLEYETTSGDLDDAFLTYNEDCEEFIKFLKPMFKRETLQKIENQLGQPVVAKLHAIPEPDDYQSLLQDLTRALKDYERSPSFFSPLIACCMWETMPKECVQSIADINRLVPGIDNSKVSDQIKYKAIAGLVIQEMDAADKEHNKGRLPSLTTSNYATALMDVLRKYGIDPNDPSYQEVFNEHFSAGHVGSDDQDMKRVLRL